MFLDSTLLSSDAIGDEEGVDTAADGSSEGGAVFKDDLDDDNAADDDEDGEKNNNDGCESNDAVATGVVMVIIDKDDDGDADSGVDCSSGVSVGGCKILPLKMLFLTGELANKVEITISSARDTTRAWVPVRGIMGRDVEVYKTGYNTWLSSRLQNLPRSFVSFRLCFFFPFFGTKHPVIFFWSKYPKMYCECFCC